MSRMKYMPNAMTRSGTGLEGDVVERILKLGSIQLELKIRQTIERLLT